MNRSDSFRRMSEIGQAIVDYGEAQGLRIDVHVNSPLSFWVFVVNGDKIPDGFVSIVRKMAGASELTKEYVAPDVRWTGHIDLDEDTRVNLCIHIWGVCKIKEYRQEEVPEQPEMVIPAKPAGVKTVPVYDCGMEVASGN